MFISLGRGETKIGCAAYSIKRFFLPFASPGRNFSWSVMHCCDVKADVIVGPEGNVAVWARVADPVVDFGEVNPVLGFLSESVMRKKSIKHRGNTFIVCHSLGS